MIDMVFAIASILTLMGFVFTPVCMSKRQWAAFKFILPATIVVTFFTVFWALRFGVY